MTPSTKPLSTGDSPFGMALAQAFMGVVFGPCVDMIWETGEIASAMREDRRTNDSGNFKLGDKKSLAGIFTRNSEQSLAEWEHTIFRPSRPEMAFQPQ
jgi:hypothetical protein